MKWLLPDYGLQFCPFYEMRLHCTILQVPSQEALTEGIVPPFYANKVQLSYSVDNAPTHIFLCILHPTLILSLKVHVVYGHVRGACSDSLTELL
jgi:hypothetical protein